MRRQELLKQMWVGALMGMVRSDSYLAIKQCAGNLQGKLQCLEFKRQVL